MNLDELADRSLVARIRLVCARELEQQPEYDFFHMDYADGESADAALLRLYREELRAQTARGWNPRVEDIVLTLCHG